MANPDTFFREVALGILSSLSLETALARAFTTFRLHLPVDEAWLAIYDAEAHCLRMVASADDAGGRSWFDSPRVVPLSPESRRLAGAGAVPAVRVVNRPEEDPVTRDVAAHLPGGTEASLILMRLQVDGRWLGGLTLRARRRDSFHEDQAELVALLNEPFALALSNALRYREVLTLQQRLADENSFLRGELAARRPAEVIGADFGLRGVLEAARQVAPLSSPVLLLGETGVGKEVIANVIHGASRRRDGPFVKVNCGALPESLIDSELFGHEKGAFTGAVARRAGRFERAHLGTLFLDEVGELPPSAQVRLLRVLQTQEFERVGGTASVQVDIRLIAATHRNLEQQVRDGAFREDLYYRLAVFPILIPPLRERTGDIPAFVQHFITRKSREMGRSDFPHLAPGAIERLMAHDWPGNVRELENAVEAELIRTRSGALDFARLPGAASQRPSAERASASGPIEPLDRATARHIGRALEACGGRVEGAGGAAHLLGVHPSTLRNRMRRLGVRFGRGAS